MEEEEENEGKDIRSFRFLSLERASEREAEEARKAEREARRAERAARMEQFKKDTERRNGYNRSDRRPFREDKDRRYGQRDGGDDRRRGKFGSKEGGKFGRSRHLDDRRRMDDKRKRNNKGFNPSNKKNYEDDDE